VYKRIGKTRQTAYHSTNYGRTERHDDNTSFT